MQWGIALAQAVPVPPCTLRAPFLQLQLMMESFPAASSVGSSSAVTQQDHPSHGGCLQINKDAVMFLCFSAGCFARRLLGCLRSYSLQAMPRLCTRPLLRHPWASRMLVHSVKRMLTGSAPASASLVLPTAPSTTTGLLCAGSCLGIRTALCGGEHAAVPHQMDSSW